MGVLEIWTSIQTSRAHLRDGFVAPVVRGRLCESLRFGCVSSSPQERRGLVFLPSWVKWTFFLILSLRISGEKLSLFSNLAPVTFPQKQTHSKWHCYLGNCHFWENCSSGGSHPPMCSDHSPRLAGSRMEPHRLEGASSITKHWGETRAQRGQEACLRSHRKWIFSKETAVG